MINDNNFNFKKESLDWKFKAIVSNISQKSFHLEKFCSR